jgi:Family of unknown function (DUF5995)
VSSVAEAVGRMEEIGAALPPRDGVGAFNRLYAAVTRTVATWLAEDRFGDDEFLERLDVVFANRYFDALRAWGDGVPRRTPKVWQALFKVRDAPDISSIQFAVAGINAHINLDLTVALVRTCADLGAPLGSGTQRDDYDKVNDVFAGLYQAMRLDFLGGRFESLDTGRVALALDAVSHFTVDSARDAAWHNAELFVDLQAVPAVGGGLATRFVDGLDRSFGYAAKGLLLRVL